VPTPGSTYRLQLRPEFTFADAADLVDYLTDLGVSHLYASPVLQAAPGSTHGYDVVDHSHANDELGGDAGLVALSDRLRSAGLGMLVDIVPNHVSVAVPRVNAWWWDVLRLGRSSVYAKYFDVDWSRGRLLVPVLGETDDELDQLSVVEGPDGPELHYYDNVYPVAPGTAGGTAGGTAREVHDRQAYELACWRRAGSELNYRRFFDISDLAAIRVEDPDVFDDSHRALLGWIADGRVDGLRIDHPDGLYDPAGYLQRLHDGSGGTWVVVEKILQPGEQLPADWACAGTTGYDALREIGALLVDPAGVGLLTELFLSLTDGTADEHRLAYAMKRRAATTVLDAETQRLARLVPDLPDAADALAELMAALPVYRTYLPAHGAETLDGAVRTAIAARPALTQTLHTLGELLSDPTLELANRFQQTSGMVMAKGVEDTTFYRWSRFVAANEVGGDPATLALSTADFHAAQADRARDWPATMTTLSTHDTKRSEDVRARLAVLAEVPDEWAAAVREWSAQLAGPDPDLGYLAWQTFVGAWPLSQDRALAYLQKAAREAKTHTSWTGGDEAYEQALVDFVAGFYADSTLLDSLAAFVAHIAPPGWSNALAQKLLQLTIPGVPDVYQGTEMWDLSLVDPDNRRPVDYVSRRDALTRIDAGAIPPLDDSGAVKLLVVTRALRLRRDRPDAFTGSYSPVVAVGSQAEHAVAYVRGAEVVTVAARLPVGLAAAGGWRSTTLPLPGGQWTNVLTGDVHEGGDRPMAELLSTYPVSLLSRS